MTTPGTDEPRKLMLVSLLIRLRESWSGVREESWWDDAEGRARGGGADRIRRKHFIISEVPCNSRRHPTEKSANPRSGASLLPHLDACCGAPDRANPSGAISRPRAHSHSSRMASSAKKDKAVSAKGDEASELVRPRSSGGWRDADSPRAHGRCCRTSRPRTVLTAPVRSFTCSNGASG